MPGGRHTICLLLLGLAMPAVAGATATPADPFVSSPPLRAAEDFWTKLFTVWGHTQVVVCDSDHPGLVWQVVSLPCDGRGRVREAAAARLMAQTLGELRPRLARLAAGGTPNDARDRQLWLAANAAAQTAATAPQNLLQGADARLRTQRGMAEEVAAGLRRCRPYMGRMRRIFAAAGVPTDLLALPLIESMYNPRAQSAAGAVGVWQLMPKTARGLGLVVEGRRDERRLVLRSSRAAAQLLAQNRRLLGSWPLAITAYNHGAANVKKAVAATGSADLGTIIAHYQNQAWGFSSRNFYAEFLSARRLLHVRRSQGGQSI